MEKKGRERLREKGVETEKKGTRCVCVCSRNRLLRKKPTKQRENLT